MPIWMYYIYMDLLDYLTWYILGSPTLHTEEFGTPSGTKGLRISGELLIFNLCWTTSLYSTLDDRETEFCCQGKTKQQLITYYICSSTTCKGRQRSKMLSTLEKMFLLQLTKLTTRINHTGAKPLVFSGMHGFRHLWGPGNVPLHLSKDWSSETIIHHDQAELALGIQLQCHMNKSVNIIHHLNKLKDCMILWIDAEKVIDKIQQHNFKKLRNFLQVVRVIYNYPHLTQLTINH